MTRILATGLRHWHSFSTGGLLLGTLFFAASLTASLLPRTFLMQGVLSGCSLAGGYGIGVCGSGLWTYMEFMQPSGRFLRVAKLSAATGCAVVAIFSLWHAAGWQNSIRELMELEPVDTAHPLKVSAIALAVFAILIVLARFFRMTIRFVATRANRFLPRRVSNVVGVIAAVALFWAVFDGVLFRAALRVAQESFREYDALIDPETEPPAGPLKTGSSASLLAWDKLGRAGREFISSGPTREDISADRPMIVGPLGQTFIIEKRPVSARTARQLHAPHDRMRSMHPLRQAQFNFLRDIAPGRDRQPERAGSASFKSVPRIHRLWQGQFPENSIWLRRSMVSSSMFPVSEVVL